MRTKIQEPGSLGMRFLNGRTRGDLREGYVRSPGVDQQNLGAVPTYGGSSIVVADGCSGHLNIPTADYDAPAPHRRYVAMVEGSWDRRRRGGPTPGIGILRSRGTERSDHSISERPRR
jgi:hypothetical protein